MRDTYKKILKTYAEYLFKSDIFKIDRKFPVSQIYVNLDFKKKVKPKQTKPEPKMSWEPAREHGEFSPPEPKVMSIDEILKVSMGLVIGKPGAGKTTTLKFLAVQHLIALIRGFEIQAAGMEEFQKSKVSINIAEPYLPIFIYLPNKPLETKDLYELAKESFRSCIGKDVRGVDQVFENFWKDGKVLILLDSFDEASAQIQQEVIEALRKSYETKPKVLLAMRDGVFEAKSDTFWNIFSDVFSILPLQLQDEFISLWVKALSPQKGNEDVQKFVKDFRDALDRLECRRLSLRKSLENPLLFKITIELVVDKGLELLDKVNSRAELYREYTDKLINRGFQRLSSMGVELSGKEREEWEKLVRSSFKEIAVEHMAEEKVLSHERISELPSVIELEDKLKEKLSEEKLKLLSEGITPANSALGYLCKHVGITVFQDGTVKFLHKTFLEYFFAQWLLDRWHENKKGTWRYLRRCLHSPDMREPILLLAGSLQGKELEDFIRMVINAGSDYEYLFHRDLLMAGLIAGETGYKSRLRDEIISKMPGWRWAGDRGMSGWQWRPWGELWRDAVIAMDYPIKIILELVKILEQKYLRVWENTILVFSQLRMKNFILIQKIAYKLYDKDPKVRRAAVLMLARLDIKDNNVIQEISDRLEDEHWEVRKAAVYALGKIGIKDNNIIRKIVDKLEDENSEVRRATVEALGELGVKNIDVIQKIVDRLGDEDPRVRGTAVRTLGDLGIKDHDVIQKISDKLEDKRWEVQVAAVYALGKLGVKDYNVVRKIVDKLEDKIPWVQDMAINALVQLRVGKNAEVIQEIVQKLEHEDEWVRGAAVEILGKLDVKDYNVVRKIVDKLEDKIPWVQDMAINALVQLRVGKNAEVIQEIVQKLEHEDKRVRRAALIMLARLGIRDHYVVQKIMDKMKDKDPEVQWEAVQTLVRLGVKNHNVIRKVTDKLEDKSPEVRRKAVWMLGEIGLKDRNIVQKIVNRLEDENWGVILVAVKTLGQLGVKDPDIIQRIANKIVHKVESVRQAAAEVLYKLNAEPKIIEKVLKKYIKPDYETLYSALQKLDALRCREAISGFIGRWKESLSESFLKRCFQKTFLNILKESKEWLREAIAALLTGGTILKFGPFEKLSPTKRGIIFVWLVILIMLLINAIEFIVCYTKEKKQKE